MDDTQKSDVISLSKQLATSYSIGMHTKLITLFIIIKVVPLVIIALIAWHESSNMGNELSLRISNLTVTLDEALENTGNIAVEDSKDAIENRAVKEIERTSTDLADDVAEFLYGRDADITYLSKIKPTEEGYRAFVESLVLPMLIPTEWVLSEDQKKWQPKVPHQLDPIYPSTNSENDVNFNYVPPIPYKSEDKPIYREISFISLDGVEQIKITTDDVMDPTLKDVSQKQNTFVGAETYYEKLKDLKPGEIYVSDVIGEYVGSKIIGSFTPENAAKKNIPFEPEKAAWAGTENPVGIKFKGIVRWAMPVVQESKIIGYVTLALNHDHIMDMVNIIMPTDQRYTELPDAISGNYAFIWDHLGRSIVHPRHHSIAGYDPKTGDPQVPWLEDRIYDEWQASGKSYAEFIVDVPTFAEQSTKKKPAPELTAQGLVGLDCRYLNNAPQCTGWFDLAEHGGSGSFIILWSGLRKLTTTSAIPYYTGQYGEKKVGFGFVTIGSGVDDFYRPALETEKKLDQVIYEADLELGAIAEEAEVFILDSLVSIATSLTVSTAIMCVLVIVIAIMLASALTKMLKHLVDGIARFRHGERQFRFNSDRTDELGTLADSFDELADNLTDLTKEPLIIIDGNKNIVYMNEFAEEWYDKNLVEVVGTPFFDISYYTEESLYSPIKALDEERTPEVMHLEDKDIFFRDKAVPMFCSDDEDEDLGYIITTLDMTEIITNEQHIENQRQILNTIFTSSPDMMWLKDVKTGCYTMVNPRFATLTGSHPSEYIKKTVFEMLDAETAKVSQEVDDQVIIKGRTVLKEQHLKFYDGHVETVEILRTPMFTPDGELTSILGIARDVTHRVEAQARLLQIQHDLESALRDAKAANAAKSDFLARMSHEIRTPMNAIIGLTGILQRALGEPDVNLDKIGVQLQHIEKSSKHLLGLLNDILDLSKIEAGKVELEFTPVNIKAMLQGVDAIVRPRCEEKDISFVIDIDSQLAPDVVSDALRLRQVLINLLGNAVKFTPEQGTVSLGVHLLEIDDNNMLVRFDVTDTGIGIAQDAIDKLFKPFEQAEAATARVYGGTGLGLSISRSIVNLLGGDITISSVVGEGSTFSFTVWMEIQTSVSDIPFDNQTLIEASPIITEAVDYSKKRVMLADDVELNRIIITEMLQSYNLMIDEVADGTEAVAKFNESPINHYDLILMDALMPQMTGYEAAKNIRELDREDAKSVPIIAVTANAFKEDVDRAIQSGMNAHLAKPVEYEKLVETIKTYIK